VWLPVSQDHRSPVKSVAWGGAILVVIGLVPLIGTTVLILATAISAGATLLSRFGRTAAAAV
jgi:xanthine/uracil permease